MGSTGISAEPSFKTNPASIWNSLQLNTKRYNTTVLDGEMYLRLQSGLLELKYRRNHLSKLAVITRNQSF